MNQSLKTTRIPIKRGKMSSQRSRTMNQNEPSFQTQPRSKFRSSFALSSLSSTPRNGGIPSVNTKKISRISNLTSPRQTTQLLSTRFASNQTRKLYELYTILKRNYRNFTFDVPEKLFDCEFSRQFTRFTTRFDFFSRQLASVYGTVNPKNVITNSSPMITSSLHMAAKTVMDEWIDFIERLNSISEVGISPHISMTNSNLTILFQNLATISTIILVDKFKGDEAGQTVRSISAICIKIKDILVSEYSKLKSERFKKFNFLSFEEDCRRCSQLTAALFEQNLPPNSFTLTEMLAIKSGIINSLSSILQILKSAMFFEDRIMNLKKSIIEFNSELNRVEAGANLQFQVELSLEEPQNDMLGDFESLENDAKKNKEEEEEFLETVNKDDIIVEEEEETENDLSEKSEKDNDNENNEDKDEDNENIESKDNDNENNEDKGKENIESKDNDNENNEDKDKDNESIENKDSDNENIEDNDKENIESKDENIEDKDKDRKNTESKDDDNESIEDKDNDNENVEGEDN